MLAGEWVDIFCKRHGIDWDTLTRAKQRDIAWRVPCHIYCWRIGVPVNVKPGTSCVECGKKRPLMTRYEIMLEADIV